jgi:glycyl-tRNA synthetase
MSDNKLELKTVVDFCKRKGFVFPSSEIYGGFAATYDFGPTGVLLKKNIEKAWRDWMITYRDDVVEIEGAIFLHPKVWEASGHIGGFSDVLVEDTQTRKRYRADHLIEDAKIMDNAGALTPEEIDAIVIKHDLKSPDGNSLGKAKKFNLLVKTHLGPIEDDTTVAYLKGEACQNIYVDYKAVQEVTRRKIPFGIAQIGKAFRNEITVKQFLFRTRELEQIDVQYFVKPDKFITDNDKSPDQWYEIWKKYTWQFYTNQLGFKEDEMRWRQHEEDEKAFYASDAWDIEFEFGKMGFKEIGGLHHRGSYDLDQHSKFSGQDLTYFDQEQNIRYNPYVIESSLGLGRMFLATLYSHYNEEKLENGETRIVLKLPTNIAPYKYAILPLMKKDGLAEKAKEVYMKLKKMGISCEYDESGSIGKRYRRQDENGTPKCICIDYDTLEDNTVTVRDRDTMEQIRINIDELK